jgi:transposase-like protein
MPSKRDSFDLNKLRERYEAGESMVGLSRSLGVAPMTIRGWLEDLGVPIRGLKAAGSLERTPLDLDELRARYERGESMLAIARAMGISRTVVEPRLRELGIPIRGKREAHHLRLDRLGVDGRRALTAENGGGDACRDPPEAVTPPQNRASALGAPGRNAHRGHGRPNCSTCSSLAGFIVRPRPGLHLTSPSAASP